MNVGRWQWWIGLLILIGIGLTLRFYNWGEQPFGFDQLQILENAAQIRTGDLVFIGPRTGPAPMFTGPLIYYLTAFWGIFVPSPYMIVATSLFMAAITGLVLAWLSRRYLNNELSVWIVAGWALSPLFITNDRVTWNPNLTLVATILSFWPLWGVLSKQVTKDKTRDLTLPWFELCLIALGSFLGYQAHFSGLLLPGLVVMGVVLGWILSRRVQWSGVAVLLATGLGVAMSLLPTVLYDLRHDWYNFQGLLKLMSDTGGVAGIDRFKGFGTTALTALENMGHVFFLHNTEWLAIFAGVMSIIWYSILSWQKRQFPETRRRLLVLGWLVMSTVVLSFYRYDKPEYYFLIQLPPYLLLVSELLSTLINSAVGRWAVIGAAIIYASGVMIIYHGRVSGVNLGNVLQAQRYIEDLAQTTPIQSLAYDMTEIDALGLKFLLKDLRLQPGGEVVHLQYPYYLGELTTHHFADLGIWVDPRRPAQAGEPARQYLTRQDYLVGLPMALNLYQVHDSDNTFHGNDTYAVFKNQQRVGTLAVLKREKDIPYYVTLHRAFQAQGGNERSWQSFTAPESEALATAIQERNGVVTEMNQPGYAYEVNDRFWWYLPTTVNPDQDLALLESLVIVVQDKPQPE